MTADSSQASAADDLTLAAAAYADRMCHLASERVPADRTHEAGTHFAVRIVASATVDGVPVGGTGVQVDANTTTLSIKNVDTGHTADFAFAGVDVNAGIGLPGAVDVAVGTSGWVHFDTVHPLRVEDFAGAVRMPSMEALGVLEYSAIVFDVNVDQEDFLADLVHGDGVDISGATTSLPDLVSVSEKVGVMTVVRSYEGAPDLSRSIWPTSLLSQALAWQEAQQERDLEQARIAEEVQQAETTSDPLGGASGEALMSHAIQDEVTQVTASQASPTHDGPLPDASLSAAPALDRDPGVDEMTPTSSPATLANPSQDSPVSPQPSGDSNAPPTASGPAQTDEPVLREVGLTDQFEELPQDDAPAASDDLLTDSAAADPAQRELLTDEAAGGALVCEPVDLGATPSDAAAGGGAEE